MEIKTKINIVLIFIASLLSSSPELTAADVNESSFSYDIDGLQNWGSLNRNRGKRNLCETGSRQSPIDIVHVVHRSSSIYDFNVQHKPAPAVMRVWKHLIEIEWIGDAGGIVIRGNSYKLKQCHWHIPCEHAINGSRCDMELHTVHVNSHGDIAAVVVIMYKSGKVSDPFISKLSPYLRSVYKKEMDVGVVDPRKIRLPLRSDYFRYAGSLTVPPCSENVLWTLFKTVKPVLSRQIKALRDAVHDGGKGNVRPLQPLKGRHVYLLHRFD